MIFSMHPDTVPYPVMRNEEWMEDGWDPLSYGQEYDPQKSFFAQYGELYARTPKYARMAMRNENCEFCNNASDNKNCYMTFSFSNAEDCMYCEDVWGSKDCYECYMTLQSERCYNCTDCLRCYNVQESQFSEHCSESMYLAFCRSCRDCFGCVNLRHKSYCIFNEQKTKEEYEAFMKTIRMSSRAERAKYADRFRTFLLQHPRPHATMNHVEDCTGNFIKESRSVHDSYFIQQGENLRYCMNLYEGTRDCMDYTHSGRTAELIYETLSCVINLSRLSFCFQCRNNCSDLFYCTYCMSCQNCFGCSGIKKKQYCIFNKQYSKEEYEALVPKIIEQMRREGSWGEFFPIELCPMPYNRSMAQRYFQCTKEQALQDGYSWHEEDIKEFAGAVDASTLPDTYPDQTNALVLKSVFSGRPFRINAQEIERCKNFQAPLPQMTYEERMDARAALLGGITLYERTCAKSGKPLLTTYPPDSPWIIWDRDVYEQEFGG